MELRERFIRVIKENEGLIFKITTLYAPTPQDRNDLYQEIVYQLWKSFASFNGQSKISTWLYRVALNTAIYHLKQTKRRVATIPLDLETERFTDDGDKEEEERIKQLYEHIQLLSLLEKGITLLYLEGQSRHRLKPVEVVPSVLCSCLLA